MQSATERRQLVLEFISDQRKVSMEDIMHECDISRSTAKRDVQLLSCSYPIVTENWRGGGVRAMDGWYLSRRYLHDDQEALLRSLLPGLQPEQQETMKSILSAFAKPSKETNN